MSIFSVAGSIIFFLLNLYCYKSLAKNAIFRKFTALILFGFIFIYSAQLGFFLGWAKSSIIAYKIAIYSIGFSFMSFCILAPSDLLGVLLANRQKKQRQVLRIFYDIVVVVALISYLIFGYFNATKTQIKERSVELKGLETPLKAVFVSDLHLGDYLDGNYSAKLAKLINAQNADMTFIVGDFIDTKAHKLNGHLEPFKALNNKAFFVTGNHEYYHGAKEIIEKIKEQNIVVLENSSQDYKGLNIAGINDIQARKFSQEADIKTALKDINSSLPTILLTHQPKSIKDFDDDDLSKIDLILSGHTHAGQIFPFSLLVWLAQGYIYGEYKISENSKLIISSGTGFWGPPMRILSNSEIVVLNLKPQGQ